MKKNLKSDIEFMLITIGIIFLTVFGVLLFYCLG